MTNRQIELEGVDKTDELVYERVQPKYIKAQTIEVVLGYSLLMLMPFGLLLFDEFPYRTVLIFGVEAILLVAALVNLWLLPKAYHYKGFAIREHDISYRSGLVFPKMVTIPFCRIQQVDVTQSFVHRIMGLYAIHLVNGAQTLSSVTIPGMTAERANDVKELIMSKIKDGK